jgi:hypothetical protein
VYLGSPCELDLKATGPRLVPETEHLLNSSFILVPGAKVPSVGKRCALKTAATSVLFEQGNREFKVTKQWFKNKLPRANGMRRPDGDGLPPLYRPCGVWKKPIKGEIAATNYITCPSGGHCNRTTACGGCGLG